jgi:hypothetical protein
MLINFVKVLSLKLNIVFFAIMSLTFSESYSKDGDLNGKIFYGKATEIINRMPVVIDEIISFDNGKIYSEILESYSVSECDYYSVIDGRRAIAFTVIKFNVSSKGHFAGREVTIDFSGDVIGYSKLVGTMLIRYSDNTEVQYSVQAQANNKL